MIVDRAPTGFVRDNTVDPTKVRNWEKCMRKLAMLMVAAAAAGVLFSVDAQPVQAQKQYLDAFMAKYPEVSEQAMEQKCNVCHGKQKKQRSEYAKALENALGEKKVKDEEKIKAALEAVESQEYADGKTYGELLKSGQLPAPFAE